MGRSNTIRSSRAANAAGPGHQDDGGRNPREHTIGGASTARMMEVTQGWRGDLLQARWSIGCPSCWPCRRLGGRFKEQRRQADGGPPEEFPTVERIDIAFDRDQHLLWRPIPQEEICLGAAKTGEE
jgi:hypothetical protein